MGNINWMKITYQNVQPAGATFSGQLGSRLTYSSVRHVGEGRGG